MDLAHTYVTLRLAGMIIALTISKLLLFGHVWHICVEPISMPFACLEQVTQAINPMSLCWLAVALVEVLLFVSSIAESSVPSHSTCEQSDFSYKRYVIGSKNAYSGSVDGCGIVLVVALEVTLVVSFVVGFAAAAPPLAAE